MGVWQEGQDGTDVNEVWRSVDGKRLFSADDSGQVRVVNDPCVLARAPSHGHRAHSSHVTAARGSWCDAWVASSGGRDCCVMQWRVVPAPTPTDRMEGYFETPRHPGLVGGVGSGVTGFDLTDIDAGVVNLRVVDRPTARIVRGKKTSAEENTNARVAGAEDDEDDGDDGIWNAKREDDIAEMDEPVDLLADAEAVVPVHKLKADAKVARYAAEFVKSAPPGPTKMWATREEVAERRRRLETELRKLGKERQASSIGGGPAAGRVEWGVPVIRGGEIPEQPRREPRIKFGPYQPSGRSRTRSRSTTLRNTCQTRGPSPMRATTLRRRRRNRILINQRSNTTPASIPASPATIPPMATRSHHLGGHSSPARLAAPSEPTRTSHFDTSSSGSVSTDFITRPPATTSSMSLSSSHHHSSSSFLVARVARRLWRRPRLPDSFASAAAAASCSSGRMPMDPRQSRGMTRRASPCAPAPRESQPR